MLTKYVLEYFKITSLNSKFYYIAITAVYNFHFGTTSLYLDITVMDMETTVMTTIIIIMDRTAIHTIITAIITTTEMATTTIITTVTMAMEITIITTTTVMDMTIATMDQVTIPMATITIATVTTTIAIMDRMANDVLKLEHLLKYRL